MVSRRELLITAVAASAAAVVGPSATVLASASQPATPVNFDVPAGACDCHVQFLEIRNASHFRRHAHTRRSWPRSRRCASCIGRCTLIVWWS